MNAAAWGTAIVAVLALVAALVAIPPGNPGRNATIAVSVVGIVVAVVLFAIPTPIPSPDPSPPDDPPAGPTTSVETPPTGGSGRFSFQASPRVVAAGNAFTLQGTGFDAANGITFRFETEQRISWPIPGFAVVEDDGTFSVRTTADLQVCDVQGKVLAYYGDSSMLVRDANGGLAQPAASTALVVTCS